MKKRWNKVANQCVRIFEKTPGSKASWSRHVQTAPTRVASFFYIRDRLPDAEVCLATLEWLVIMSVRNPKPEIRNQKSKHA